VYEETLTGQPHDTSLQIATSDNENVDAVYRHALDITRCGCSLTSCPGPLGTKRTKPRIHRLIDIIKLYQTLLLVTKESSELLRYCLQHHNNLSITLSLLIQDAHHWQWNGVKSNL